MNKGPAWLKEAVIYSLYPQSFFDSNGDGIGDLPGITRKLDYIRSLGCTAIWMTPIFDSDFQDAGYDVKDFYKIAPRYGTEEDLVVLCQTAHSKGLRILLDLVAGHTSTSCAWFQEACQGPENPCSDRYIWTEEMPATGKFAPSPGPRSGFYMYNYYTVQPSINYGFAQVEEPWQLPMDHPAALENREELIRILDYWFSRGVDGFRVDMASSLIKNDPGERGCTALWQYIRSWMDRTYPENALISEWSYPTHAIPAGFHMDMLIHNGNSCLTTLFRHEHFAHKMGDKMFGESYFRKEALGSFDDFLQEYLPHYRATCDQGYMSFITGSHDIKRLSLGRDPEDLKAAYAFILTMPGVPINYYGDEIGMRYLHITTREGGRDRTGSRTPMQWNGEKNHGFSTSDAPYLPVDDAADAPTVARQEADPDSLLHFVRSLTALRKAHPALWADGSFEVVYSGYPAVYQRCSGTERLRIAINPAGTPREFPDDRAGRVLFSHNAACRDGRLLLGPRSCLVYEVSGQST